MSYAYRCEVCNAIPEWRIERQGDVVTTWADSDHLAQVCQRLQRDWEQTRLVITAHAAETTPEPEPYAGGMFGAGVLPCGATEIHNDTGRDEPVIPAASKG